MNMHQTDCCQENLLPIKYVKYENISCNGVKNTESNEAVRSQ